MSLAPGREREDPAQIGAQLQQRHSVALAEAIEHARVPSVDPICTDDQVRASDLAWGFALRWTFDPAPPAWREHLLDDCVLQECQLTHLVWSLACERRADWREPRRTDRIPLPEECFERLHRHLHPAVRGGLRRYARDEDGADELANFAWIKLFTTHFHESAERPYFAISKLETWLVTVGRRERAARQKKDSRSVPLENDVEEDPERVRQPEPDDDDAPDLEQALRECLAQLPPKRRLVLSMLLQEGVKQVEIAARLNVGKAAIANHVSRGLERLRPCLTRKGVGLTEGSHEP